MIKKIADNMYELREASLRAAMNILTNEDFLADMRQLKLERQESIQSALRIPEAVQKSPPRGQSVEMSGVLPSPAEQSASWKEIDGIIVLDDD